MQIINNKLITSNALLSYPVGCEGPLSVMASEVSMQEMSEVVIVTIPESVAEDLPSVTEEDTAVLVTTQLSPQPG